MTAYKALIDKARIRENEICVITAAAGGVGSFAIQIAKIKKCKVIAVCSANNFDFVKELGADFVIDYNTENVEAKIKEITNGRGADVFLDCVSSESATMGMKSLAFGGQLVFIAGAPDLPKNWALSQLSVHAVFLSMAYEANTDAIEDLGKMGETLIKWLKEKKIKSGLIETISFEQIPKALENISKNHTKGKIVAKIN